MEKKKFGIVAIFMFALVVLFSNVFAVDIYDYETTEEIYKLSEDSSDFNIPFARVASQRMEINKSIDQTGIFASSSSIDVTSQLKGLQIFYSNDTVRINSDIEYAVIICSGNVVLNSNVERTLFVYCNGDLTIGENANVQGDIMCYATNLVVNGTVSGDILGSVTSATINNELDGAVRLEVTDMSFGENGKVNGGIEINTTNTELTIDESVGTSKIDIIETQTTGFKEYAMDVITATLTNLVILLLIVIIVKNNKIDEMTNKIKNSNVIKNGLKSYLYLLIILCFGIVLLLALTKLGIAALIFSAGIMIILTILKNVIFVTFEVKLVKDRYAESEKRPKGIFIAIFSFLMLEILENIPYIGVVVSFIIFIMALGMITSVLKQENNSDDKTQPQEVIKAE